MMKIENSIHDFDAQPVIKINVETNEVYLNQVAKIRFPAIQRQGINHHLFHDMHEYIFNNKYTSEMIIVSKEIEFNNRQFEHQIIYFTNTKTMYICQNNITDTKALTRLQKSLKEKIDTDIECKTELLKKKNSALEIENRFLKKQNTRLHTTLNNCNIATWHWDAKNIIFNDKACLLLQLDEYSPVPIRILKKILVKGYFKKFLKEFKLAILQKSPCEMVFSIVRMDESMCKVHMKTAFNFDRDGALLSATGVFFETIL
jgi:hypothetical protein